MIWLSATKNMMILKEMYNSGCTGHFCMFPDKLITAFERHLWGRNFNRCHHHVMQCDDMAWSFHIFLRDQAGT